MSGEDIAAEVSAALREVAQDVGDGAFLVTLHPQPTAQVNPWDAPGATPDPVELAALDDGIREVYVQGSAATRRARMVTVEANGTVPAVGDSLTIDGLRHAVLGVMPLAPSGVALLYDLEISSDPVE